MNIPTITLTKYILVEFVGSYFVQNPWDKNMYEHFFVHSGGHNLVQWWDVFICCNKMHTGQNKQNLFCPMKRHMFILLGQNEHMSFVRTNEQTEQNYKILFTFWTLCQDFVSIILSNKNLCILFILLQQNFVEPPLRAFCSTNNKILSSGFVHL